MYLCRVVLRDSCGAQITPQLVRNLTGVETANTKKIQKFLQILKMRKFRREELDRHEFSPLSHANVINLKYIFVIFVGVRDHISVKMQHLMGTLSIPWMASE